MPAPVVKAIPKSMKVPKASGSEVADEWNEQHKKPVRAPASPTTTLAAVQRWAEHIDEWAMEYELTDSPEDQEVFYTQNAARTVLDIIKRGYY